MLEDWAAADELPVAVVAKAKALIRHAAGWPHNGGGVARVGNEERTVLASQKSRRVKGSDPIALASDIQALAHVEKCGNIGVLRPKRAGDHGADVRCGDALRRLVSRMPVILVTGVKNAAKIADAMCSNQRAAVHDAPQYVQDPAKV